MRRSELTAEDRELLKHLPVIQGHKAAARLLGTTEKALYHKGDRGKVRFKKDGCRRVYETVELLKYKNQLSLG